MHSQATRAAVIEELGGGSSGGYGDGDGGCDGGGDGGGTSGKGCVGGRRTRGSTKRRSNRCV